MTTTTSTVTKCPSWCDSDHADPDDTSHGVTLAEGQDVRTHGPVYRVGLQLVDEPAENGWISSAFGTTELYVSLESGTLTADQAEVFGRALIEGARLMRESGNDAQQITVHSFQDVHHRWQHFRPFTPTPTPAEQALSQGRA